MAHEWDSYFHNLPPLSSDPSTLRRTSELEDSLSPHIENFIEHHDFSSTVASHEAPETNSNFNTNYYSNPSIGNSSSDCVYQRYYKEAPWQADVEQLDKDYSPRCGNTDISDFATDGLSASGSFPSSLSTHLQGLKQDCGMLATSFLEDYSDVSSCSDADIGETRPSCKFMASNSVPKPKTDETTNLSSSEWLFTHTGNMTFPTKSLCPNLSDANVVLPSPSNVQTGENIVKWEQDKMEVNTYAGHNQSSTTSNMVTTTWSETVEDINDHNGCQDQKQKVDVVRDLTQGKYSNISISGPETLTGDGIEECRDGIKEIKQSLEVFDHLGPTGCQDKNKRQDEKDRSGVLQGKRIESGSSSDLFDEQKSPNSNFIDGQDENMETDCQVKEIQSDPPGISMSDSKDATHELRQCASPLKSKESESVAHHSKSYLKPDRSSTELNPCLNKKWTCAQTENTNTKTYPDPNCNGSGFTSDRLSIDTSDQNVEGVSNLFECGLQSNNSTTDIHSCPEKERTSPAENTNTTSSPAQQQLLHQSLVPIQPESVSEDVAENARESFEELDRSTEEQSVLGVPYGEPLSREDSSCDTDEIKVDVCQYKGTSVDKTDGNGMIHSEGQAKLKSSTQMRENLHPVVILKMLESVNGTRHLYHCADCQHTSHNVSSLIEHHHCCHSGYNFQFCETCNLYLMRNEQAEKHLCSLTKESPQLSSDSSLQKKRNGRYRHKCVRCGLLFSHIVQYVRHMRSHTGKTPYKCNVCGSYFAQASTLTRHKRIPGRCKTPKPPLTNSDAVIDKTKRPPQKYRRVQVQNKPHANLPECYVKLVDISKTHMCKICGKSFSTAVKATQHFHDIHMRKCLAVSSSRCTTKANGEKSQKAANETRGKYKCPLCPRLFKYSYNRSRHLHDCIRNSISGGKGKIGGKYRCPLCHATFTLPSNRYRHIKTSCFRECLNQLAKERAESGQNDKQKTTQEIEQKTLSKENEQKTLSKENEQKKHASKTLTAPKSVPRYKCNHCPAIFCYASGKYRHMKKHELFKLTGKMFGYRNSVFSTMSKPATLRGPKTEESKDTLKSTEANRSLAFSCTFCGKRFGTSQSLKKHECTHRDERPYRCLECGKGFKKHAYLIGHKIVHQRRIQCTVCKKILSSIGELIQHRSSHLKRGKLKCPDCHLQFEYPARLLRHLEAHKDNKNKAPQLEVRSPLKPEQSSASAKEQNGQKPLQCSLCKEVFNDAQVLRKHCLTHISATSLNQCPFCKHNYTNRRYLLRHMIIHTGDKPLSCTNCGKQFYRDLYLELHTKKCFPQTRHPTKRSLQCCYCPRVFDKKIRLKTHHRGHKTNSLLLCSRCGQYFGFRKLNQHQKNCTETTERNTGLSSLDGNFSKSTSQTNQDVQRMPSQSNATKMLQFKCPHCTQRFRYRSVLLRHLVSHTGVQPYACGNCGHRYRSRSMCLQHEASCDGVYKEGQSEVKRDAQLSIMSTLREAAQKPQAEGGDEYKCKFCTKTFVKSRSLRRHILTHNEVKPYRCKACDSCFSRYDHLKVHQARCKGKRKRLEVCIPKISLDDIGKGWQSKFCIEAEKQETFDCEICSRSFSTQSKLSQHDTMFHAAKLFKCTRCGSSYAHEKSLKKHRNLKKCRKLSEETNASLPLGTNSSTENVEKPPYGVRNRVLQRSQPYYNKKYKFVCSYCPRAFKNMWQLGVHTRLHTGERPFACVFCGQRFIRKDYLQRHFLKCPKKQHQDKVLCDRCGGVFSQVKLENHKKSCNITQSLSKPTVCQSQQSSSQSSPKGFSCAYCSSRYLLFSQLQEHFLNAHKTETLAPPLSTAPLQQHLSNIPQIKEEPLEKSCDEQLKDGANLVCDLDTAVEGEVPNQFSCPECNKIFASKAGLTSHLRVHSLQPPFSCKICKRGFQNKNRLRNHFRKCRFGRISGNTTQQLELPLNAEIDFALNDSVLVFKDGSKTTGTGVLQTNFSCKEDLTYESPQTSESSQGSSSQEKKAVQYQCSECDKSFTDGLMLISHLEDHGRQEQEKKRNACPKCGRVCSNQGNLEKHMRIHGIKQKYSCPDCPKMVYSLSDLEIHRTCHDQNRPYICKLCNQRFWTRPSLCSHYSDDHPEEVFSCRFCTKTYSVKKSLARHYRKWHQNEQKGHETTIQEKSGTEQQSSSQVITTGESDENEKSCTEDSDSDSAPYFPCHVCGKTFPTSESLEDHQRCHLGEKPHECAECGRCFFQASQLQQHQRMHKSEFQCQACGRGFVTLFALRKHKHTHGKSRPYRCTKCHFSFPGPSQLAEHMSIHREENFPCDICNRVFLSKSSRAEHRRSHYKSGDRHPPSVSREEREESASSSESSSVLTKECKYRCCVCSERFRDPEELSEHGCKAATERPYSCSECNIHFLHASHLKKHRTTHQLSWSRSEYPCNQCNNSFSSSQNFLSHLKSHVNTAEELNQTTKSEDGDPSPSFICPVCHRCYASAAELIGHFPTHPDGTFDCKICEITFPSGSKLEEHKRRHLTSATEFECTECGQSFLGSDAFRQHRCSLRQHTTKKTEYSHPSAKKSLPTDNQATGEEEEIDVTGEDLYNCPVCAMQFPSKSGLLEHQNKYHRHEKPFKCEICGKTFAMRRYLREHVQRHLQKSTAQNIAQSPKNKLKCNQCHAIFSTAQELSLHMRSHAEKEVGVYRCDMCYKSFIQWSLLKQHQESHVGQVVYECTECDKAFAFPHLLEEHQQTHAGSSQ